MEEKDFIKSKIELTLKNISEKQKGKIYSIESLTLVKGKEFLKFLKSIVSNLEQLLRSNSIGSFSSLGMLKYLRFKTWNNGTKGQFSLVKENSDRKTFDILLKNTHETFGPNKTKLKVQGSQRMGQDLLQKELSISYDKLSSDEKCCALSQLLYCYTLNTFEKAVDQSVEQFDNNPIIYQQFDRVQYKRICVYDNASSVGVLTMQILGLNVLGVARRMLGVKVSYFDPDDCQEHGVFLASNQSDWDMKAVDKQSKIKRSVENVPFSEYLLTQIFKSNMITKLLVKKLLNVELKVEGQHLNIASCELKKRKVYLERIENLLNWQEVSLIE